MKNNSKKGIIFIGVGLLLIIVGIMVTSLVTGNKHNDGGGDEGNINLPNQKEESKLKIFDTNSKSRPYAVMINNIGVARQVQSGLSEAYLVYEMIAEGGITRYLALYKDTETARIGSIRSARHYYLDYVLENDAIFVHWGWSPQAREDIPALGIDNIHGSTYEGVYFYRDNPFNIAREHTGFSDMSSLKKAAKKRKYRTETNTEMLLEYSPESVVLSDHGQALLATNVTVDYSSSTKNEYIYDASIKLYKRFVNDKVQTDYNTKEQITVKNILVYEIEYSSIAGDVKGRLNLNNIGSGEGYFISEGQAIKITWEKEDRESKTKYYYEDGTELVVNDGNTFIQLMPTTGKLVIK